MKIPSKFLFSDLIHHRVRCDQGIDHGPGIFPWMYPSFHRLLGWISSPSNFKITREVWRLDQLIAVSEHEVYVKGQPSLSDQQTLDRFPTLMHADIFNNDGDKIGLIADFVFEPKKGKILYYLVSRSNPSIPGSSRWRLEISHILDQQPGSISSDLNNLEDLPIYKASIKEELLNKSRKWRTQFQDITGKASHRLEGWFEEQINENDINSFDKLDSSVSENFNDDWIDDEDEYNPQSFNRMPSSNRESNFSNGKNMDPWI